MGGETELAEGSTEYVSEKCMCSLQMSEYTDLQKCKWSSISARNEGEAGWFLR